MDGRLTRQVVPAVALDHGFRVGDWEVRPRLGTLTRHGEAHRIEPRVMGVLVCLARTPGETVTREEFIEQVWSGRVVTDEVLSRCISILRNTFEDDAREPRFIQTLPRIGYRLLAEVTPLETRAEPAEREAAPSSVQAEAPRQADTGTAGSLLAELKRRNVFRVAIAYAIIGWFVIEVVAATVARADGPLWVPKVVTALILIGWPVAITFAWLFELTPSGLRLVHDVDERESLAAITGRRLDYVIVLALIGTIIYAYFRPPVSSVGDPPASREVEWNSIAVLPFDSLSSGDETDYFANGLADEIRTRLATVRGLRVAARGSSSSFQGRPVDAVGIGRKLGVAFLLEGSVRTDGESVRIVAELVDTQQGYEHWTEAYEAQLEGIFDLQDRIANEIVAQLGPTFEREPAEPVATAPPTENLEAYSLVLRGRTLLETREEENIRRSIALFEQAVALDPAYADGYVELAKAWALLPANSYEIEDDAFDVAHSILARGRERIPSLDEHAQDVLAYMRYRQWEWLEADRSFQRALVMKPQDSNLLQWHSQFLACVGRMQESLESARRAFAIDPWSPVVSDRLAVAYLWTDADLLSEQQFNRSREIGFRIAVQPDAQLVLLIRRQRYAEARELAIRRQQLFARPAEWIGPVLTSLQDPSVRPAAAAAVAKAQAEHDISLRYTLGAWMYLDDSERAFETALRLLQDRSEFEVQLLFSREARVLRRHPRFQEIVRALGLDRYWDATQWPEYCRRIGDRIECG